MIIPSRLRLPVAAAGAALVLGGAAALHYSGLGLTLSHYDARGHLIVARRVVDSLTPGWQQVGAVWLPLPHLLNLVPVQVDAWFRTGLSAVALSVLSFGLAVGALAWIAEVLTGSRWAVVVTAAVFALNPNILYLQATPMTETLFLACTLLAVARLMAWCEATAPTAAGTLPTQTLSAASTGALLAAACTTRYEAWPVTAAALGAAALALGRRGASPARVLHSLAPVAAWPILTALGFMVFSRAVVGQWFVSSGFFVPDPTYASPLAAARAVWDGTVALSNVWMAGLGTIGLLVAASRGIFGPHARSESVVAISIVAAAVLPWVAFADGHPYRVRYMIPMLAVEAIGIGVLVGLMQRAAPVLGVAQVAMATLAAGPVDPTAAMVLEAQWDRPHAAQRAVVTACLTRDYDRTTVMGSMGSLGHYMQELARQGFSLRDFLHEGNGDIWLNALDGPRPYVGWVLVEEEAEGGDQLAQLARDRPEFLRGFRRVCEGGGVALYRRAAEPDMPLASDARPSPTNGR